MPDFHFVPAASGFYALWRTATSPRYGRTIITAWEIEAIATHIGQTRALIEGENTTEIEAILCPDGTVQSVNNGVFWLNVAAWLASDDVREAA